jgi:hypothetical protein
MQKCHTGILLAVSRNRGMLSTASFGLNESFALYDRFYTFFRENLGIELIRYVLESDQGPALNTIECLNGHLSANIPRNRAPRNICRHTKYLSAEVAWHHCMSDRLHISDRSTVAPTSRVNEVRV